jgi:hypothetical protein
LSLKSAISGASGSLVGVQKEAGDDDNDDDDFPLQRIFDELFEGE